MSLDKLKVIVLDYSKTFQYFLSRIKTNNMLSKEVIEKVDFKNGNFFTILRKNYLERNLYNFKEGIFPSPKNHGYKPGYVPKRTIKEEMIEWIYNYLNASEDNCALMDYYNASSDKENLPKVEEIKIIDDKVFYFLTKNSSKITITMALYDADILWHLLGVLSEGQNWDIPELCKKIQYIFTTAYDGEGYIIWEKNRS